ncbi:hypothetical protein HY493_01435 [Candidatus Woesearchaeota archaeon]|nr:hypothetical protein [Candidatus Woesearchaeota archaeon]
MPKEIDKLFEKEQDVSKHLKDVGVILLDLSDSVQEKLTDKDTGDVKGLLATFTMNCQAMIEDITESEAVLKGVRAKQVTVKDTTTDTAELKLHLSEVKQSLNKLLKSANEFLSAKNRDLVFQEMNKDYSDVLGSLTELMAESV